MGGPAESTPSMRLLASARHGPQPPLVELRKAKPATTQKAFHGPYPLSLAFALSRPYPSPATADGPKPTSSAVPCKPRFRTCLAAHCDRQSSNAKTAPIRRGLFIALSQSGKVAHQNDEPRGGYHKFPVRQITSWRK
jgi:hypothetical protein